MLPLAMSTVFPSPYIYKETQHVTAEKMSGYEEVFEYADEDLTLAGVREGPLRYSDGINGVKNSVDYRAVVPGENFTRLDSEFDDDGGYLVVTRHDYQRETEAFRGLRYSEEQFATIGRQASVNHVYSSGGVNLYAVR
jgi:hypothetical protein